MNTGAIKSYLHRSFLQNVVVCAAILILTYFFEELFLTASAVFLGPFGFYGGCADDSDGDSGTDSGTDGGDFGFGGNNCSYCDDNSTSDSTSTPYLYIQKKDGSFVMQNDVMIGTPPTYVQSREMGVAKREAGMLGHDVYPVNLADVDTREGINMQIREIEPEESFIYHLRYHLYNVSPDKTLIQDWTHQRLHAVHKENVSPIQGKVFHNGEEDVSGNLSSAEAATHEEAKANAVRLQKGDTLLFNVAKSHGGRHTHLVVSSFWRNWMAGMDPDAIHGVTDVERMSSTLTSSVRRMVRRTIARTAPVIAVIGGFFFGGVGMSSTNVNQDDDLLAFIKKANVAQVAFADSPHGDDVGTEASLVVSYKHPGHGMMVHIGTVQPRVYMPTDEVVSIPDEAFKADGTADIQVEATKAHYVKNLSVFGGNDTETEPVVSKEFARITKKGSDQELPHLNSEKNEEALHMTPGDILELQTDSLDGEYSHVALEISGFYTPLSKEQKEKVEDWQANLEPRERMLIESMYG